MTSCHSTPNGWKVLFLPLIFRHRWERPSIFVGKGRCRLWASNLTFWRKLLTSRGFAVLFKVLRELEDLVRSNSKPSALISVQEARSSLGKTRAKMNNLESGFDPSP